MLYETISAEEFKRILDDAGDARDFVVLDARTPMEFEQGHVKGAINVSHDEVAARVDELSEHKDRKIYVICRSGARSAFACDVLSRMGFTKCVNVMGGHMALDSL